MDGFQKYKEQSIYSMSPVELLLLLYNEAIKQLKKAEYALEDEDYGVFDNSINRVVDIVRYLNSILNMDVPISQEFRRIYESLFFVLSQIKAGRQRKKDSIAELIRLFSEFHDGFEEAGREVSGDNNVIPQAKSVIG